MVGDQPPVCCVDTRTHTCHGHYSYWGSGCRLTCTHESRWSTVMCVSTLPQQYAPLNTHTHTCMHTHRPICAIHIPLHFTFSLKCIHTHLDNNQTSLLRNCKHSLEVKGLLFQCESQLSGQQWEETPQGLCMCASLLTLAKPPQRNVYFCTFARAPFPYICTALTVFVSKHSPASNPAPWFIIQALVCLFTQDPGATVRV